MEIFDYILINATERNLLVMLLMGEEFRKMSQNSVLMFHGSSFSHGHMVYFSAFFCVVFGHFDCQELGQRMLCHSPRKYTIIVKSTHLRKLIQLIKSRTLDETDSVQIKTDYLQLETIPLTSTQLFILRSQTL